MALSDTISKLRASWFTPVNNGSLVTFRILFGLLMLMDCSGKLMSGWAKELYIDAPFTFTFIDFDFLNILHGQGIYAYFIVLCISSIFVMLGLFYRPATVVMALLWSGIYFSQKAHYNNHYYLMMLLCWLMTIVPANARASLDAKLKLVKPSNECPKWCVQLFVIQIAIVYTYAAIAKMYPDWLLAKPVKIWFSKRTGTPYVGHLFGQEWFAYIISYAGILFDLLIVPALLWKPTRVAAVGCMLLFHYFNGTVFGIGIFPYLAMSLNVFFFPGATFDNVLGKAKVAAVTEYPIRERQKIVVGVLLLYITVQILLPVRHHFIKGDVLWTEEGHRMSWRMMLRTKRGYVRYIVKDKHSDKKWEVIPTEYMPRFQANELANAPDMIWQFAQYLEQEYRKKGYEVAVYAKSKCSVNGRPDMPLVDSNVDLASTKWNHFRHNKWILTRYE